MLAAVTPVRDSPEVISRHFRLARSVDLGLTLRPLRHGSGDPTIRISGNEALRATRTPSGPATLHLRVLDREVEARAWGPGAGAALDGAPDLLGAGDDPTLLETDHPVVGPLHRRLRALRLCRSGAVLETLVPTILEQKITSQEARRSFRALVRRYGEPAPGPGGLLLQPAPEDLARLPYWAFHPFGVARTRAETIRRVCAVAPRLEHLTALPSAEAATRLRSLQGVGPWTTAIVLDAAFGDPDAVVVGDFHLPHAVTWALAGEARGDDDRMLELLAEFPGQRGRVMRLIAAAGLRPPATTNRRRIHRIEAH
jgi:3-methyladenine DNA glycosylase/8-oxoguanine DNA glycosylase